MPSAATAALRRSQLPLEALDTRERARRADRHAVDDQAQARGRGSQAEVRLPREDVHDLAGEQAVGVGRSHLDLVGGVRRRLTSRRDRERSGSPGQWADERVEVGAVMQSDLGLDVPVVEVEAGRVAGERVVGDRVARPVQLAFGGRGDGQLGRQPDLDHDRLRRRLVPARRHRKARGVDALRRRRSWSGSASVLVVPSPNVQW